MENRVKWFHASCRPRYHVLRSELYTERNGAGAMGDQSESFHENPRTSYLIRQENPLRQFYTDRPEQSLVVTSWISLPIPTTFE